MMFLQSRTTNMRQDDHRQQSTETVMRHRIRDNNKKGLEQLIKLHQGRILYTVQVQTHFVSFLQWFLHSLQNQLISLEVWSPVQRQDPRQSIPGVFLRSLWPPDLYLTPSVYSLLTTALNYNTPKVLSVHAIDRNYENIYILEGVKFLDGLWSLRLNDGSSLFSYILPL